VMRCVAVCCGVLQSFTTGGLSIKACAQCVTVYCSILQCVAVCYSVLQCVAVCCIALQCVAVRYSVFTHACAIEIHAGTYTVAGVLQCVAACCNVL